MQEVLIMADEIKDAVNKVLDAIGTTPAGCTITRNTVLAAQRGGDEGTSFVTDERDGYLVHFWTSDGYAGGEVVSATTLAEAVAKALDKVDSLKAWIKSRREQDAALGV
jgi:hypothetical protein